ncbi:holliday junction resolvasome [Caudoviricetes sp.]|nr:holliday junction resolvasome [Caudoviricetes sp.]
MKILALDLGTKTGWACGDINHKPISSTAIFKNGKNDGDGVRYWKFRQWLLGIYDLHRFDRVFYESVMNHTGVIASHVYGGLQGVLLSWCEENKIPYVGVGVGTIKKHATGKGNADKEAMIQAMVSKGHTPKDDNEADALSLFYYSHDLMRS